MKTISLSPKLESFSKKIQPKIFSAVINAILAKSIENGELIKELSLYLTNEEIEKIIDTSEINLKISKKIEKIEKINKNIKTKIKKEEKEEDNPFFGIEK